MEPSDKLLGPTLDGVQEKEFPNHLSNTIDSFFTSQATALRSNCHLASVLANSPFLVICSRIWSNLFSNNSIQLVIFNLSFVCPLYSSNQRSTGDRMSLPNRIWKSEYPVDRLGAALISYNKQNLTCVGQPRAFCTVLSNIGTKVT